MAEQSYARLPKYPQGNPTAVHAICLHDFLLLEFRPYSCRTGPRLFSPRSSFNPFKNKYIPGLGLDMISLSFRVQPGLTPISLGKPGANDPTFLPVSRYLMNAEIDSV